MPEGSTLTPKDYRVQFHAAITAETPNIDDVMNAAAFIPAPDLLAMLEDDSIWQTNRTNFGVNAERFDALLNYLHHFKWTYKLSETTCAMLPIQLYIDRYTQGDNGALDRIIGALAQQTETHQLDLLSTRCSEKSERRFSPPRQGYNPGVGLLLHVLTFDKLITAISAKDLERLLPHLSSSTIEEMLQSSSRHDARNQRHESLLNIAPMLGLPAENIGLLLDSVDSLFTRKRLSYQSKDPATNWSKRASFPLEWLCTHADDYQTMLIRRMSLAQISAINQRCFMTYSEYPDASQGPFDTKNVTPSMTAYVEIGDSRVRTFFVVKHFTIIWRVLRDIVNLQNTDIPFNQTDMDRLNECINCIADFIALDDEKLSAKHPRTPQRGMLFSFGHRWTSSSRTLRMDELRDSLHELRNYPDIFKLLLKKLSLYVSFATRECEPIRTQTSGLQLQHMLTANNRFTQEEARIPEPIFIVPAPTAKNSSAIAAAGEPTATVAPEAVASAVNAQGVRYDEVQRMIAFVPAPATPTPSAPPQTTATATLAKNIRDVNQTSDAELLARFSKLRKIPAIEQVELDPKSLNNSPTAEPA